MLRVARVYLRPRWTAIVVGVVSAALAALFTGLLGVMLKPTTDQLLSHADVSRLGLLPALLVVVVLARGLASVVQAMLANRIGLDVVNDVQTDLVGKLMHADLARLRATHTGGFVSQVLNDAGMIRNAATTGLLNYVQSGLTVAAMVLVMLRMDWLLTALTLLVGPAVGWVLRVYSQRVSQATSGVMKGNAALTTVILETLGGVRVVKMENREDFEKARVSRVIRERRAFIVASGDARATAAPVSEILTLLMAAAVIWYATWRIHAGPLHIGPLPVGTLTPGSLVAFLAALLTAGQSLRQFADLQTVMAEGTVAARRVFDALDIEPEIRDRPGAMSLPPGAGAVRLEGVTFAYGDEPPVLDDLNLEARRGEIVALVGPSGGGKTTALNLVPRFYDVKAGRVTIDGHDVRDVTLASLRSQIALVTQEPFLFDDTIAGNIAYGDETATQGQIEAAARQAAAHEFIVELPKGYQTRVSEAGMRLSGGQRQRIAIARAFLKNAPILLLDEATSALDSQSEAQVQLALERLMSGRTTILIAHRLSTVRRADRIYVIDRGRCIETGAHASLIRRGGLYARLAGAQDLDRAPEPA